MHDRWATSGTTTTGSMTYKTTTTRATRTTKEKQRKKDNSELPSLVNEKEETGPLPS
jgi:hypothetical protein